MIKLSRSKEIVRQLNGEEIVDYHHKILLSDVECGIIVYNVTDYGVFLKALNVEDKFRRKGIATYTINLLKNSFNDKLFIGGVTTPDSEAISFWSSLGADFDSEVNTIKTKNLSFCIPTRKINHFI